MNTYKITVNGVAYDVTVEGTGAAAPAASPAPQAAAAPAGASGSVRVEAQVAGKIWKITATAGQSLKAGDAIVILESMKMEIPVVAPQDGTLAGIHVSEGAPVEVGDLIASMN